MIVIIKQIKECKIKKKIMSSMDYFPLNIKAFQNKKKSKITIFNNKQQQSLNHQKNNNFNKNKNTCILNTSNSRHNMFNEKS